MRLTSDEQLNCEHTFYCIYRHPTSDQECKKCGLIVTHTDAVKYDAESNAISNAILKEQKERKELARLLAKYGTP